MGEEEESPDNDKLSCVGHESRGSMCHFVSQFFFFYFLFYFLFLNISVVSGFWRLKQTNAWFLQIHVLDE